MLAVTRSPRVLVKLAGAPGKSAFRFGNIPLDVQFERLYKSIRPRASGLAAAPQSEWHIMTPGSSGPEVNSWDLCHHLVSSGLGIAGVPNAEFAEPDFEQQWTVGTPLEHAIAAARTCDRPQPPDTRLPIGEGVFWFRDGIHSQLEGASVTVGQPNDRVRIAHLDTGYDPGQTNKPAHLLLERNFVEEDERPNDATDHTSGILTNLGHGTGTLSLLALGGAQSLDVIPIRVANSVVRFRNSAIAKAFDYVHQLFGNPETRAHVVTMSMGGLASQAWAEAVNALYELGIFIVTAAGNNFGHLPVNSIVYPARFGRVVAACGVMADGKPYADLPLTILAGNYGPDSKMDTAMAAYTPNTPWAKLGCQSLIDHDGRGTSSSTPQIASAAALWIQNFKGDWETKYPEGWMRVEAVRKALFETARLENNGLHEQLGRGILQAGDALTVQPADHAGLQKRPEDQLSFPFLRLITGLGAAPDARQRMLEVEALQLTQQSQALEQLLPDPERPEGLSDADRQSVIDLLHDAPGASKALRSALEKNTKPVVSRSRSTLSTIDAARLELAMNPSIPPPETRSLRVFAFDPLVGYDPDMLQINQTTLEVDWEDVQPGPVGEYLEIVDVDPATGCCYAPVDLNHPTLLSQNGLTPSEANPRFHQQMVYAVAMKTIEHFERALGRVALWAPRFVKYIHNGEPQIEEHYVARLRIYPHALREENSFYSPVKKALLLGYFPASQSRPGENLPGGTVFCALSHDIIAHETTHALLDGLHRYFGEPTNEDVMAFHEAFADIVALFQHFTVPEALRDQIRRTRGNLAKQNMLGELALQFGQGIGKFGALRSAIPKDPTPEDYRNNTEAHDRGAVLVAAVFDAFLNIYRRRSADLIRLATGGTGVLPEGEIPNDLVSRLSQEASKTAGHVLNICIRALDYCPPVDLRFGEYLRALITADRDLVPEDTWAYRPAFIQGFRRRGIYPENVRNLSSESLSWEPPETGFAIDEMFKDLELSWDLRLDRREAFAVSRRNGKRVHDFFKTLKKTDTEALGFYQDGGAVLNGEPGELRPFEVHSVRPVRRIGPDGQQRTDLVVEITQSWLPAGGRGKFRGGCTLIIDIEKKTIRYVVRKRVGHPIRMQNQERFQMEMAQGNVGFNYFGEAVVRREPFAMIHRGV
jgi:hypothetical protein